MIFDIDNWREIGATLGRNKTRTFLTAFGIFWGTAMLALLWGGAQGLQGILKNNFNGFASNSAILWPSRTTMPYKGYKKGMSWNFTTDDIDNIRRVVPEFEVVSPIISRSSSVKGDDHSMSTELQGIEPNFVSVQNPVIVEGRFINDADLAKSAKVCVLGVNVAHTLFGADSPLGKNVCIDNVYYTVVGVVKQRSEVSMNGQLDDNVCVPLTTYRRIYNMGKVVGYLSVIAKDGYRPSELKPKLNAAVRLSHPIHPADDSAVNMMDISEMFEAVDNVFKGVDILILFVGLSSLIAGVIGVGNIMWIIVKERTQEFGIRRALGAKPRSIMSQILAESAILTTIAGLAGISFAVGVLMLATKIVGGLPQFANNDAVTFQLSFAGGLTIMFLFLTLGTAAGTIPALKAMQIKPIEALNSK